jgi:hypothetical protein
VGFVGLTAGVVFALVFCVSVDGGGERGGDGNRKRNGNEDKRE